MEYNGILQELISSIKCKVYWDKPNIKFTRTMINNFLERTLETDRLQTDNIFLTTDLWKKAMLTSKKTVGGGYFNRTINPDIFRVNFSELAVSKDENNKVSLPVVTTIQFDNYTNPDNTLKPINYTTQNRLRFERLFSQLAKANDIDSLYQLADLSQDFSIHSYYIPTGISTKNIGNSCLLLRYDHCSLPHYNGAMPPAYRYVYPNVVNEPHFHFNSGFGSLYKLTPKLLWHSFGVGYAIGVTGLKEYLEKLHTENFKDEEERKIFMENDFGMPFLHYKLADIKYSTNHLQELVNQINRLAFDSNIASNAVALETAYKVICTVSNTKTKPLYNKKIAGTLKYNNDDIKKW